MTEPVTPLPPRKPVDEGFSADVAALLSHIKDIGKQMREAEQKVVELGKERRQTVTRLREHGIPWKKIAEWAGVGDQALFKHQKAGDKTSL